MADSTGAVVTPPTQNQNNTYTVNAGDTFSGIGAKLGMNWQDIYNANKGVVGNNPNLIRPGMVLNIPGSGGTSQGNTTDFKLDIPSTLDSSTVNKAITNPITQQDLEDAIASNKNLGTKITNESIPGQNENDLNNKIADIRAQEDTAKLNLQKYENALPEEGISEGAIRGRSGAMARDVNLDLQTMALQEKNLITKLGLEKMDRQNKLAVDKGLMSENDKTIANYNAIQKIIDTQKNQITNQASKLTTQARTTLNSIFSHFKGLSYNELTPDSQTQISQLAHDANVPLDMIIKGMEVNKQQTDLNLLIKNKNLNKPTPSPKGATNSGGATFTADQIGELGQTLDDHKGSDKYTDTSVYTKAMNNWTKAGGLQKDFLSKFPPKIYLNPNDPSVPANLKQYLKSSSSQSSGSVPGL